MFKLFKSSLNHDQRKHSVTEIIEEIHDTFYTEVDRLLESAKVEKSSESTKEELIKKCDRLESLGFTNTKEVKEAKQEIERINKIKRENSQNKELVKVINYFSLHYPQYKFITEDSVKKICEKYGLIYGEVSRYKGTVPDKNLKEIENFKVKDEDCLYIEEEITDSGTIWNSKVIDYSEFEPKEEQKSGYEIWMQDYRILYNHTRKFKSPLEIAAPQKDFYLRNMEIKNFKLQEIPDPVVLHPVQFNKKKYYLVVTAWGVESQDELVVNQKMN